MKHDGNNNDDDDEDDYDNDTFIDFFNLDHKVIKGSNVMLKFVRRSNDSMILKKKEISYVKGKQSDK